MFQLNRPLKGHHGHLLACLDVEWTKNFHIRNGNRPFCFSLVSLPDSPRIFSRLDRVRFGLVAAYAETPSEERMLIQAAASAVRQALCSATTIVGHQLSSDLGVLINSSRGEPRRQFTRLKTLWSKRRNLVNAAPLVVDTRYDLDHLFSGASRRLVDMCAEARFDVTQPELTQSMTRLQNQYFTNQDSHIRERLVILNIRHSLSTALLCLRAKQRRAAWSPVNVNWLLRENLAGTISYLDTPAFLELLER